MAVPFLDLHEAYAELKVELDAAIARALNSGQYILGAEVKAFEEEFAAYCEAEQCIGVGNGLDALRIALLAMDVGPGDEVLVPSNTFIATWLAVSQCGAIPVPIEPDSVTYNIDASLIEAAITDRTKAIIPVHLYGQPVDLDPVIETARANGILVLEDAAQAHGARYKGRRIGAHGDAVAWSFYPGKNLGAMGDGGAVTTDNPDIAEKIRLMRNYGSRTKYVNEIKGFNSRLDPLQSAVLRVKLRCLDEWNERRRLIANRYIEELAGTSLVLPLVCDWTEPVWHLYVVRTKQRDSYQASLEKDGITTLIHYPTPPHMQAAYADLGYSRDDFPIARKLADEVISLPIGPHLSEHQVSKIVCSLLGT